MSTLTYPNQALLADGLRGIGGALVSILVLVGVGPVTWLQVLLALMAGVFVIFALRAWLRSRQRFGLAPDALEIAHRQQRAPWSTLHSLKLAYFSTRRDHREGWLELKLGFTDARVSVDSRLEGFEIMLDRALDAARTNGVDLSTATRRNLDWLGRDDPSVAEAATDA